MAKRKGRSDDIAGEVAEATSAETLAALCVSCQVEETWVSELVAHGAIIPAAGAGGGGTQFTAAMVMRVRKAKRLARDFDLNAPGVALVLDLLDEIEGLRGQLRAMTRGRAMPDDADHEE